MSGHALRSPLPTAQFVPRPRSPRQWPRPGNRRLGGARVPLGRRQRLLVAAEAVVEHRVRRLGHRDRDPSPRSGRFPQGRSDQRRCFALALGDCSDDESTVWGEGEPRHLTRHLRLFHKGCRRGEFAGKGQRCARAPRTTGSRGGFAHISGERGDRSLSSIQPSWSQR